MLLSTGSLSNLLLVLSFARVVSIPLLSPTKPECNPSPTVTKPPSVSSKPPLKSISQPADFLRTTHGHRLPAHRAYKPKVSSRTQQHRPRNRNMTLDNTRRPTQSVHCYSSCDDYSLIAHYRSRQPNKRMKYFNKPCPRFTTTGASRLLCINVLSSIQVIHVMPRLLRCLQPWSHLHVPARPQQDCDLLELFAWQLSQHRRVLQSFT